MKRMRVYGVECPKCFQRIWSRHRHDFRYCFCEYCFVDGGRDYMRSGYGGEDWPEPWIIPRVLRLNVEVSDGLQVQRNRIKALGAWDF